MSLFYTIGRGLSNVVITCVQSVCLKCNKIWLILCSSWRDNLSVTVTKPPVNVVERGSTDLSRRCTGINWLINWLLPQYRYQTELFCLSPEICRGVKKSNHALNNPGLRGFITVDTGLSSGPAPEETGIAPAMPRDCPDRAGLDSFPVTPGCIKHFKTTGAVSRIIKVYPDLPRTFMVPPGLYSRLDTVMSGSLNRDLPGSQTVTVRTRLKISNLSWLKGICNFKEDSCQKYFSSLLKNDLF